MSIKSTTLTSAAVLIATTSAFVSPAWAQADNFPQRPITLVVGFSAGGSNDIAARVLAQPLSQALGVPVVVENKLGAAGTIAANYVAKAAADGHTILVASVSPLVVSPHTQAKVPYNPKTDFSAISLIGVTPEVLALNSKVQAKTLADLSRLSQTKEVTLASSGNGGLPHLAIELLKRAAPEAKFMHVPYKGASAAVADAVAGHVDGVVVDLPAVYSFIQAGQLQGIAVADETRSKFLPNLTTSGEQKLTGFVAVNWIGLLAPAKTSPAIVTRLHETLQKIVERPEVKSALEQAAIETRLSKSPQDFQQFINKEDEKWSKVVKESGAKAD